MKLRQYVYFALSSQQTTAEEISERLSLLPDEVTARASKPTDPPRRVLLHTWEVSCRDPGLYVDQQIGKVMERLTPHQDKIIALAQELKRNDPELGGARFSVVRYFNADDGEEEQLSPPDDRFQKLPGQHQLLGWALEPTVIRFLADTDAIISVDEYS